MTGKKNKEKLKRILEILKKRESFIIKEAEKFSDIKEVPKHIRESILDELGDEFCAYGLKNDDEPNTYGLEIEGLTDYCNILDD